MNEEYVDARDALYEEKWLTTPHVHHAYYDDEYNVLQRQCARCHKDLTDELHLGGK